MPLIQESSTFTINGGNLTNIEGEQLIHVQSGGTLVQYIKHFGRKATPQDLDLKISNYLHVPVPVSSNNLHIQRSLLCDTSSNVLDQKYNAHRTVNHIACIEGGLEKDSSNTTEFLQVVYDGPDAFNAYQEDFERFSQSRDPQSVQLFGYNWDRDVPSLIFYEALIPVSYILEKHRYSPILRTYIEYMFGKAKMLPEHHGMLFSKLWINARTNTVHEGPYIHVRSSSKIDYYAYGFEPHSFPHHDSSVDRNLPISTYDETNILLGRLVKAIPTKFLLLAIRWSNRSTYECDLKPEDVVRALSCLPGTIYHMIRKDIVARWPGDMERWKYVFCAQTLRTTIPRKAAIMDGASEVRFAFTLSEAQNLGSGFDRFDVCYQLGHFDEWQAFGFAWTVQADNVFTQLGIEDRSGEYGGFEFCVFVEE
ncbi:hypothetical protein VNI00_008278 [Paramarasmius palmivorus]|uniref:Uncharacterized protein n=1 Tax=Paramarasmius palmivorus TaxID=297713 RepID=A0AAW0CX08_9AGAR